MTPRRLLVGLGVGLVLAALGVLWGVVLWALGGERREERMPRNLADMPGEFFELEEIDVAEWHPERDGRGSPTQVHCMLRLKELPEVTFVMRFKGPQTLAQLITALTAHGRNVFGAELSRLIGRRP
jgi:hypothetical protein